MPDSIINKVEKFANRDRAKNRINFKNRHKEIFDLENNEYNVTQVGLEQDASQYPDWAAEFHGIEMLYDQQVQAIEEDGEKDESEETANAGKNCKLGEIPNRNDGNERE